MIFNKEQIVYTVRSFSYYYYYYFFTTTTTTATTTTTTAGGSKLAAENLRVLEARFSFCSPSSFLQMKLQAHQRVNDRY